MKSGETVSVVLELPHHGAVVREQELLKIFRIYEHPVLLPREPEARTDANALLLQLQICATRCFSHASVPTLLSALIVSVITFVRSSSGCLSLAPSVAHQYRHVVRRGATGGACTVTEWLQMRRQRRHLDGTDSEQERYEVSL